MTNSQYDNKNRFVLFKNRDKRNDKDADYTGNVNVDGEEYWLNGWIKQGPKGAFISGTIKPKKPKYDTISTGKPLYTDDNLDDSIPF